MKFENALEYCKSLKMSLAVPENRKSSDMLKELTGGTFFLGITDKDNEGDFRSIYSNKSITFFDWNGRDTHFTVNRSLFPFFTFWQKTVCFFEFLSIFKITILTRISLFYELF